MWQWIMITTQETPETGGYEPDRVTDLDQALEVHQAFYTGGMAVPLVTRIYPYTEALWERVQRGKFTGCNPGTPVKIIREDAAGTAKITNP